MEKRGLIGKLCAGSLVAAFASSAWASAYLPIQDSYLPAVQRATTLGSETGSNVVHFALGLMPRYRPEFEAYCNSVSNPRSYNYRNWLTPSQVGLQFGASSADVASVSTYLASRGLTIEMSSPNRMCLLVRGTVNQIQAAFSTQIKDFRGIDPLGHSITFRSNNSPLMVPAALAGRIQCVSGIETYTRAYPRSTTLLTPPLTRGLYNTKPSFDLGFNGQGRSVGVSSFDGYRLSNVPLYISQYNLPTPAGGPGSNVVVVPCGAQTGPGNPSGEGDLDIQMELGMAPLATILIYDGSDRLTVTTKEASDNQADVLSESYGWFPSVGVAMSYHDQQLAMTAQGQSYFEATGDNGTTFTGYYPNIEPEILQVGGTIATVDSNTGTRIGEVGWSGSTGGWYVFGVPYNVLPSWMVGTGVPTNINYRLNPDVALHAAGDVQGAYDFFYQGSLNDGFDGTSFASPMTAGCMTTIESRLAANGVAPRMGRLQDLIYSQNGDASIWFDILQGDNGQLPNGQEGVAGPGWDFVTGWGAPNFDAFYQSLLTNTTSVPYVPTSITTAVGSYIFGDETSVGASDGVYYEIGSTGITQFGQAAGATATFFVPQNATTITIDLESNSGGEAGGTNMVWLLNQFTGNYDLIGACPMRTSGSVDQTINVRSANVPLYIGVGGEVDMLVRGHVPIRPFNNQLPVPFTYNIDLLELLVR